MAAAPESGGTCVSVVRSVDPRFDPKLWRIAGGCAQAWDGIKNLTWYGNSCYQKDNVFTILTEVRGNHRVVSPLERGLSPMFPRRSPKTACT